MCNLYRLSAGPEEIARMFDPVKTGGLNLPPLPEIFPDYEAPVVIAGDAPGAARRLAMMRWGWPGFGEIKRPITNIRNLASPMWRSALANPAQRCLVPVSEFSEWSAAPDPVTKRKKKHWFALRGTPLFAFAGLWRSTPDGPRYAFLTCEANTLVGAVHPKAMPVILKDGDDAARWLSASGAEAAAMQCALADELMHEVVVEDPPASGLLL